VVGTGGGSVNDPNCARAPLVRLFDRFEWLMMGMGGAVPVRRVEVFSVTVVSHTWWVSFRARSNARARVSG
jgi:hypothetical protein